MPYRPTTDRRVGWRITEDRDIKSTVAGRESSGVGGIRADAMVVPLCIADDAAASSTTTHPTGLERRGLFLMWEVGLCCDSVPEIG